MHIMQNAFNELIQNPKIKNRTLCLLCCPMDGFAGSIPMFWITLNDTSIPIYYEPSTEITQADSNIVVPKGWRNVISDYFDKNYVKITSVKNGFKFSSLDPKKVFFNVINDSCSLGKNIINKKELAYGQEVVTEFTLLIDEQYLKEDLLFIRWNYKTKMSEFILNS